MRSRTELMYACVQFTAELTSQKLVKETSVRSR